jgi:hypothetical protein
MTESTKAGIFERLDTTIVRVSDILSAKKWYEEVLELKQIFFDENEKLAVYNTGDNLSFTIWQIKPEKNLCHITYRLISIFYTKDIAQFIILYK